MTLEQIFQLQRTKTNQELSDMAMQLLHEKLFTGTADEIANDEAEKRGGWYDENKDYFSEKGNESLIIYNMNIPLYRKLWYTMRHDRLEDLANASIFWKHDNQKIRDKNRAIHLNMN